MKIISLCAGGAVMAAEDQEGDRVIVTAARTRSTTVKCSPLDAQRERVVASRQDAP
jgi:hypothetical protein